MRTIEEKAEEYGQLVADGTGVIDFKHVSVNAYMDGYNESMRWTKLSDDIPTVDKNGEKLLICRLLNESQSDQNPSVYPTKLIHLCNPTDTWWMEIPKLPI